MNPNGARMGGKIINRAGFTLVELLMIIAIIGLLATIALPEYGRYKARVFNVTAESDLAQFRNAVVNMEAISSFGPLTQTGPAIHTTLTDVKVSKDVKISSQVLSVGTDWVFVGSACHPFGDTGYYLYVPLGGGDPYSAMATANQIAEGSAYRAPLCP